MPTIARIGNIKIQMFGDDHAPPHFHVRTPDRKAVIALADLEVLRGSLRRSEFDTVVAWARQNQDRLENEWRRLRKR